MSSPGFKFYILWEQGKSVSTVYKPEDDSETTGTWLYVLRGGAAGKRAP